ncbi:MAG TPA: RDD family protein [Solirubrobacteraceae bacterium]|jgi:uncharacterized RDD family membrane protein YckC|nr:RDD family protein [Solirubrobacteraceae bacterium]
MAEDPFVGALRLGGASTLPSPRVAAREQPPAGESSPVRESTALPQVAIRARLNAIILDLVLLGLLTRLLAGALAGSVTAGTEVLLFWGLQFGYFFALEARSGQTVGKRVFHVRVATLGGASPTARQIAVRNVLRIFDALPLLYASGLISVMRTGRNRRQRIGDVAAGTTVVLDSHGRALPTPRWLLPTATVLATLISLAVVIPAVR